MFTAQKKSADWLSLRICWDRQNQLRLPAKLLYAEDLEDDFDFVYCLEVWKIYGIEMFPCGGYAMTRTCMSLWRNFTSSE